MIQWGSDLEALSGALPGDFSLRGKKKNREVNLRSWAGEPSEHISGWLSFSDSHS